MRLVAAAAVLTEHGQLVGARGVRLLARVADAAQQTLTDDADDRRGDEEGLDAHVEEAVQCGNAVGAVERGEHEVTGERGLDGDACRVGISDLTDEDDVGVLTEDGLEAGGEREARLVVGLDLVDAGEHVLDRVLDRGDVLARRVDLEQRGVQRGGLAGAGRAGADHHAERRVDHLRVVQVGLAREARARTGRSSTGTCRGFA